MSRRERKKEETRNNIIESAESLFREKGFKETLMEEISEKADVSKGTLYNYFPDKESILVEYFQKKCSNYAENREEKLNSKSTIETRLRSLFEFINEIFVKDIELATTYFGYRMQTLFETNPFDNPKRSGLEKSIVEIISFAQKNNELRTDIDIFVIARNLQFLIMSSYMSKLYSKESTNLSNTGNQIIEVFLNGAKLQK